ncbi:MAG TPA: LuxR C-terminal-related transcriptional regulator [Acidimicrobiales bacterium]|nr:LuxR C-terminal-related transcriptional regulator [Acidimicrobiales bacterium]
MPPPTGRSQVARARLDTALEEAVLDAALVLVSSPAGSGKSVALSGWIDRRADGSWYSLDPEDNDPALFWPAVNAALGLRVGAPGPRAIARALFEDGRALVVLVLDDYHFITNPEIHAGVDQLLVEAPASLRLVISTRHDPPLALSRLRSHGALREVRYAELKLVGDEVGALLDAAGIVLPREHLERLTERTDGWAAAVQLVGISARQDLGDPSAVVEAFAGDNRHIFDYFRDEVLDQLPPEHRDFLLDTAILERLTAPLCEAVTGRAGGQRMLEDLERRNLFVLPLDHRRRWFRYHHLFAEWLRLQVADDPVRHRAAADWLLANGQAGDAVRHLLAAGDVDAAAGVVEQERWILIGQGRWETLREWMARLPADTVHARPGLSLAAAWLAHHLGRWTELHDLVAGVEPVDPLMEAERLVLEAGRLAAIGAMDDALATARAGLPLVDPREPRARTGLLLVQGRALLWSGDLEAAARSFADAAELAQPYDLSIVSLIAESHLAEIDRRRDRREQAQDRARAALAAAEQSGLTESPESAVATLTLADLLIDEGRDDEARALVDRAAQLVAPVPYIPRERQLEAVRGRLGSDPRPRRAPAASVEQLTGREMSVLRLLPSGLTPREIAEELYLSHNTIKTHTRGLYRKLGVASRHEAVEEARRRGLLANHPPG